MNVDGGYLTFKLAFGSFDTWQYKYGANVDIFAMDHKPKRKEINPNYKLYRNAGKDAVVSLVWELRNRINEERLLPLCEIDGLEADDIVACWYLFNPQTDVIGVDKDFFQLPGLTQVLYHDQKPYLKSKVLNGLPDYVTPLATKNFALYQMLLGDPADNIPRLLEKGKLGKEQLDFIENSIHLETALLDLFGDEIVQNAKLVLMPYFDYGYYKDWFSAFCVGRYYDTENWGNLYKLIWELKENNRVGQDNELMSMFSI